MTNDTTFKIDIAGLKSHAKDKSSATLEKVDKAGDIHGFVDRRTVKKRGRPASPRTGQVHARVLPHISEEISLEAKRRGVQQGVLIEEAWQLYCDAHK